MKCEQGLPEKEKTCQKDAEYKFRGKFLCETHLENLREDMSVWNWLNDSDVENPPEKL